MTRRRFEVGSRGSNPSFLKKKGCKPQPLALPHTWRFSTSGPPGELNSCQIKATDCPGLTRFKSVSDTGDWNPTKGEKMALVAIGVASGSNAATQHEPPPEPPPFK